MGSHSVACHPAKVTFPPLPQPKLILDLATPKGCKAEYISIPELMRKKGQTIERMTSDERLSRVFVHIHTTQHLMSSTQDCTSVAGYDCSTHEWSLVRHSGRQGGDTDFVHWCAMMEFVGSHDDDDDTVMIRPSSLLLGLLLLLLRTKMIITCSLVAGAVPYSIFIFIHRKGSRRNSLTNITK